MCPLLWADTPVGPTEAQQHVKEFLRFVFAKRRQAQLGVVGLLSPLVPILGAIVHQQQNLRTGHTLTQRIEKSLRLGVDPVQVFKDEDERLVETLAQEELLERLERPPPPNLRVHLLQRRRLFFNAQQGKEIGQGVFQAAVKHQHFASDFLPALPFVILRLDVESSS